MRIKKIIMIIVLLFISISSCYANSAEPPSLIIISDNVPDNIRATIIENDRVFPIGKETKINETYFLLYSFKLNNSKEYKVKFETDDEIFYIDLNGKLNRYNNIYTLNYKKRTLTEGKKIYRSVNLITLRVILTLLIEGFIFYLFKYREKRSWLVFLIINLITQGALNIWINTESPINGYIIFGLIIYEFFILIAEIIALPVLINEKKKFITASYVVIANITSLVLGGYIIFKFPV